MKRLGLVWPGTLGLRCFPEHPRKIRKPDVAFIRSERITPDLFPEGYCPIAPDLAAEVLSPGDLAHEIVEKIEEYFSVGVRLVWVVDPESRVVDVYRLNGQNSRLRETDILDGEAVLPGFRCPIKSLFPNDIVPVPKGD